ncbi:EmrB/QacA subfamily drug resistance transporter [Luteibacter rhizovicinus]|uniref:EmrB/QacA subfamily drug resistance transporter n=1 Tax=Luteibacter rhizovicinus TaxID=242606 RepID=A0A4R3YGZ7_9GAMM|nr:DHA2 family efflux MFS transporter permease subunit [Luteibacter rhizovicinus]TCV91311.1 EmrB/QacA subfamily drug resistance transporter [Luteibacter rhizovicinus]
MVWKIAGVVMLGPLMTTLDSTVVNISLSTLGKELNAPLTLIQWVTTGYLLALALMLPLSGWLVDRVGAKRIYLGCFTVFTLASMLCGIAGSANELIAARMLQGAAGGLLAPMAQMMLARIAGRNLARVMGIAVMPVLIGPILGPALAGFVLQHAGWRWLFYINLPVGIAAVLFAWYILPRDGHETVRRPFDLLGFMLLSPAIVMSLHGLEALANGAATYTHAELAAAVALLIAFFWHGARRGGEALIDLRLFRTRTFSAAAATQFLSNGVLLAGQMLFPLYLLTAGGRSPAETGLLFAPTGLGLLCMYPMMGRLTDRFGPRRVSSGGAIVALLGTLPFAVFDVAHMPTAAICVLFFIRGLGFSCINLPSLSAAYAAIPKASIPVATTALNICQRLGGPVATTGLVVFLHAQLGATASGGSEAYLSTLRLFCVIQALCAAAAMFLPMRTAKEPAGEVVSKLAVEAVAE